MPRPSMPITVVAIERFEDFPYIRLLLRSCVHPSLAAQEAMLTPQSERHSDFNGTRRCMLHEGDTLDRHALQLAVLADTRIRDQDEFLDQDPHACYGDVDPLEIGPHDLLHLGGPSTLKPIATSVSDAAPVPSSTPTMVTEMRLCALPVIGSDALARTGAALLAGTAMRPFSSRERPLIHFRPGKQGQLPLLKLSTLSM